MSATRDETLMLAVQKGDRMAFGTLFDKYKVPIVSYLFQIVQNRALAEELAQDVFLSVFRARESYRPEARFTTWLWTIARNAGLDALRKKGELPASAVDQGADDDSPRTSIIDQAAAPDPGAEARLVEQADRGRLEHCLGGLTAPQREALTLRLVSELSYEEIAQTMRASLSATKSLINRARVALALCLGAGGKSHA